MWTLFSMLLDSTIPVGHNAVKNVLFNISTFFLKLTTVKLFAYAAFKSNAYMPYLMFAEDFVQKLFFIVSRRFNTHGLLVLAFAIVIFTAGQFDTLLWAIDHPGYVIQSMIVPASTASIHLLANPAHIIIMSNKDTNLIDIEQSISGNLYKPGFNFSLPAVPMPNSGEIVPSNKPFHEIGPCIWLDEDGFCVSFSQLTMAALPDFVCPIITVDSHFQEWICSMNNSYAWSLTEMAAGPLGILIVTWGSPTNDSWTDIVFPNRVDNPWRSFGTEGGTGAMKQVFTVIKGQKKHTFLQTVFKFTMIADAPSMLDDGEITDMLHRTFSQAPDPSQPISFDIQFLAEYVISAKANGTSATMGTFTQENYSVASSSVELLNPLGTSNQSISSLLRISFVNITLIRSETLKDAVMPLTPCSHSFSNFAQGGKAISTTCLDSPPNRTVGNISAQVDISSVIILGDMFGNETSSTSAGVLNQTGFEWYEENHNYMNELLVSRSIILGGNSTIIPILVQQNVPALSYLQVTLVVLPFLLFTTVLFTMRDRTGFYDASFLTAVCATIHVGDGSCREVGYLHKPADIKLRRRGGHTRLETPGGGYVAIVGKDQVVLDAMSSEPFTDWPMEDTALTVQ